MATWTGDNVWLAFNLSTLKAVIFQYTRTVREPIMEHQIFNMHITQYRKYLQKKIKTFSGTKEPYYNLSSRVIALTYWRYIVV